jgi:hypothetical protein
MRQKPWRGRTPGSWLSVRHGASPQRNGSRPIHSSGDRTRRRSVIDRFRAFQPDFHRREDRRREAVERGVGCTAHAVCISMRTSTGSSASLDLPRCDREMLDSAAATAQRPLHDNLGVDLASGGLRSSRPPRFRRRHQPRGRPSRSRVLRSAHACESCECSTSGRRHVWHQHIPTRLAGHEGASFVERAGAAVTSLVNV